MGTSRTKKIKIIPVQYGDASCVLVLKTQGQNEKVYAEIYDADKKELVCSLDSTPFPYGCDLSGIKYVQSFDVIFFAEPNTFPCKLVRKNAELLESGYVWTFEQCDIMPEPLLDWNYTSEHLFKISAIPDEDARYTKEDGTTYYPKGTLRKASSLYATSFWRAKEDAPSSEPCTNLDYYEQFMGGQNALAALTVDGTNTNENLKAGMLIALRTKNQLTFSENLNYDDMPVGTEYSLVNPPVVCDAHLSSLKSGTDEELRPSNGGGYGWSSDWLPVRGKLYLKTNGKWSGTIRLQELSEDGNLTELAKITSENAGSNTELARNVRNFGSAVRLVCTRREKAYYLLTTMKNDNTIYESNLKQDSGCQIELKSEDNRTCYIRLVEKRALSDGTQCWIVECLGGVFGEFETDDYALGAWSKDGGYPRHISIYQERMVYAGNGVKPMTIWLSKTNDWGDFELGTEDTAAMSFTVYSEKYDAINWIKVTRAGIFAGTEHGEYLFGEASGGVATARNSRYLNTSNVGGESITGVLMGDSMFVVKKGAKEVHTVAYNSLTEESAGTQVSMTAKHLFEDDPIVDMFATKSPTNSVYFLCESGKLASLTYEPVFNVEGWARHEILDGVVAGTIVRRDGVDILALVVKKDGKYLLGELNPNSDVYTDDGENYESILEPTPIVSDNYSGGVYGHRTNFAGADIYVDEGERFYCKLYGGEETRVDLGFNSQNKLTAFDREKKIELNANSSWCDEAGLVIRTNHPAPLSITAIGARVKHA